MSYLSTPWIMQDAKHQVVIVANGKTLMETRWKYTTTTDEELEYMKLAAAAPDLLKALQQLLSLKPCSMTFADDDEADRYFKAIARAEMAIGKAITIQ